MIRATCVIAGLAVASAAVAATVDVSVTSAGNATVTVAPGATVDFEIRAILDSDADNDGLAFFSVDLGMAGPDAVNLGELATVIEGDEVMDNFSRNEGYDNNYGGTPIGDNLVQIGGASNTIANDPDAEPFEPFPGDGGFVPLGVGHSEVVLAVGTVMMPMTEGTYTLSLSDVFANVITLGELGPIFAVEAAVAGASSSLTIEVTADAECEGDANGDGVVDPLDSGFVLARFGCPVGTGDEGCDAADQNGDGVVDPLDSGFVLARFGPCP
ncbi:MAG: hypothetical protein IID37_13355 [Planctomycetes bacterium]|nr:hypothetical protein [Planctomycetota bacterium]